MFLRQVSIYWSMQDTRRL